MTLHIKNMVCNRCIMAVEGILKELDIKTFNVNMGIVEIPDESFPSNKLQFFENKLNEIGFELIDDKKSRLIESIKNLIISKIHHEELTGYNYKWSELISDQLHYEYKYLSRLFSSVVGITIEQFIILQKIEKVKELMVYDELTLSEIAWRLSYSSIAHLSNQFKKITGMSPKQFKETTPNKRKSIDKV